MIPRAVECIIYVILPVVIPSGMEPHEALNDNKVYRVVWQVLQALRSHDDSRMGDAFNMLNALFTIRLLDASDASNPKTSALYSFAPPPDFSSRRLAT